MPSFSQIIYLIKLILGHADSHRTSARLQLVMMMMTICRSRIYPCCNSMLIAQLVPQTKPRHWLVQMTTCDDHVTTYAFPFYHNLFFNYIYRYRYKKICHLSCKNAFLKPQTIITHTEDVQQVITITNHYYTYRRCTAGNHNIRLWSRENMIFRPNQNLGDVLWLSASVFFCWKMQIVKKPLTLLFIIGNKLVELFWNSSPPLPLIHVVPVIRPCTVDLVDFT